MFEKTLTIKNTLTGEHKKIESNIDIVNKNKREFEWLDKCIKEGKEAIDLVKYDKYKTAIKEVENQAISFVERNGGRITNDNVNTALKCAVLCGFIDMYKYPETFEFNIASTVFYNDIATIENIKKNYRTIKQYFQIDYNSLEEVTKILKRCKSDEIKQKKDDAEIRKTFYDTTKRDENSKEGMSFSKYKKVNAIDEMQELLK